MGPNPARVCASNRSCRAIALYALDFAGAARSSPDILRGPSWPSPFGRRGVHSCSCKNVHQYAFIRMKVVDCHEDIPRVQGCSLHRCPLCGFWLDILRGPSWPPPFGRGACMPAVLRACAPDSPHRSRSEDVRARSARPKGEGSSWSGAAPRLRGGRPSLRGGRPDQLEPSPFGRSGSACACIFSSCFDVPVIFNEKEGQMVEMRAN